MLENKKAGRFEAHYSRYIASWRNAGGKWFSEELIDWLKSEGLDDAEIRDVVEMATCGKMELERSADEFVEREREFLRGTEAE